MDTVTYPDAKVINFINKNMVPLRISYNTQLLAMKFNVKWTPTIVILDSKGKEHSRAVGFFASEELIPLLLLGLAKMNFDMDRFDDALINLEKLLSHYPKSDSAPEAIYLKGVSLFKSKHNPKLLKDAYEKLRDDYPASEWKNRAYPYRLI